MPDVSIQLRNIENGQETKSATTAEGSYLVTNLAPGRYRVAMSKTGFRSTVRESVLVSTATLSNADFVLELGTVMPAKERAHRTRFGPAPPGRF